MPQLTSAVGLLVMIFLAWLMSPHKRLFPWRVVTVGLVLQATLAAVILSSEPGRQVFEALGDFFTTLLGFVDDGCRFVFGEKYADFYFAFRVLPTVIFFSSLMAILYHLGIMQQVVRLLAVVMQKTLRVSGAESLSAAANIFVGQTEAPFVVRPYLPKMTESEIMAVMTGGFATICRGVLAIYIGFGIDGGHLITASFISAPASLVIAKVMLPETQNPATLGSVTGRMEKTSQNLIDAATSGASEGLKLALNVGAMLIAFLALIAMLDYFLTEISLWIQINLFGRTDAAPVTLSLILSYLFAPLAWLMGVESGDCLLSGELLGLRMVANELVAYERMASLSSEAAALPANTAVLQSMSLMTTGCTGINYCPPVIPVSGPALSERSTIIMTYALSGFANFSSIGIQVGGISGLAPERRSSLVKLGFRAMLGGMLACFMTACMAGVFV